MEEVASSILVSSTKYTKRPPSREVFFIAFYGLEIYIEFARANIKSLIYNQTVLEGVGMTFPQTKTILENGKVSGVTATDVFKYLI